MPLRLPHSAAEAVAGIARGFAGGRTIRAVNFHASPPSRAAEYRAEIARYAAVFAPLTRAGLDAAMEGRAVGDRPLLMPVLFEGFRDNLDVLLPILEEHGFTAWFHLPPAFLSEPAETQRAFAAAHDLHILQDNYPGERIALDWAEAGAIAARGHVFACHSRTHVELAPDTPEEVLEAEIVAAKAEMEAGLDAEVDVFCWLRGAEVGLNPAADRLLRAAGYRYLMSNFKMQRLQ